MDHVLIMPWGQPPVDRKKAPRLAGIKLREGGTALIKDSVSANIDSLVNVPDKEKAKKVVVKRSRSYHST
jgi:hypothetical protein